MSQSNTIEKVAIIGAGGHVGKHFAEALLKTGKHTVTAITREGSKSSLPEGVKVAHVNYDDDGSSLASALKGQQFLVITLSVFAPEDLHGKIVNAAVKAGIKWIMPNAYGTDTSDPKLAKDNLIGDRYVKAISSVQEAGASSVNMVCGHWYEWSLALGEQWYGIDIKNRTVTFFDDGKTMVNDSTWLQCGRALAALLSLPVDGASPSLSQWKNKSLYIASFRHSQRDMLDSLNRVLGTTDKDWAIKHEDTPTRYQNGLDEMKAGDRRGFAKAMYTRNFFPNGGGEYESKMGLANEMLGLPKESLDEATKRTVDMLESGWNPFDR